MNVTELARQLKTNPQKLLQILPEFGFDVGARAVKIDDRVATQIQKAWRRIKFVLDERERKEAEKQKELEKANRRESGVTVAIPSKLTVREFAERLTMPVNKLIVELMKNGILAAQNENIDHDTAMIVAQEMGFTVVEEERAVKDENAGEHVQNLQKILSEENTAPRPPVIVVMGHVDHGKTKLLDAIRETNVVDTEAGGITQHIGAYQVIWTDPKTKIKKPLTFIDTPGHEAFTVMRSRGAKVADIAILVVAADDSVKPQTIEVINIIKAAKLPVVVAINKIDKPGADAQKVRNDLSLHGIVADDWGGETPVVEISAKQKLNIDKLLDTLMLVGDMNEATIRANADRPAAGTVIEARVSKGEGPVATILVQTGTLHLNDALVINGEIYGKVRAMKNYRGENMTEAAPSTPVRILGFKIAPAVGDVLDVSQSGTAQKIDLKDKRAAQMGAEQHMVVKSDNVDDENKKAFNILVKTDVLGSLEAIIGSIEKLKNDEVSVKIVGKGLGNITADDVGKAQASGAVIYGFNVFGTPVANEMMQKNNIFFRQFKIIYDMFDDIKEELQKLLNPEFIVTEFGNFKVLKIFRTERHSQVLGGRVEMGKLIVDAKVRVKRDGEIMGIGKLTRLQSSKQNMTEIPAGTECGVQYEGKTKVEEDDILEAYTETTKSKKLVLDK
ncbi:MAG: translation initiation factor IF-2 [Candidatus Magasanikbacteria bacterium]|jgi:translation initiation factor IF-2